MDIVIRARFRARALRFRRASFGRGPICGFSRCRSRRWRLGASKSVENALCESKFLICTRQDHIFIFFLITREFDVHFIVIFIIGIVGFDIIFVFIFIYDIVFKHIVFVIIGGQDDLAMIRQIDHKRTTWKVLSPLMIINAPHADIFVICPTALFPGRKHFLTDDLPKNFIVLEDFTAGNISQPLNYRGAHLLAESIARRAYRDGNLDLLNYLGNT